MKDHCLVSVGTFFDDGFSVNFDATHVHRQKGKLLIIDNRYPMSGLYFISFGTHTQPPHIGDPTALSLAPLTVPIEAVAYSVHLMTTKSDLVQ